jgi:hypothetical protein
MEFSVSSMIFFSNLISQKYKITNDD